MTQLQALSNKVAVLHTAAENNEITENEYSEKVGVIFEQIKNLIPRLEIGHAKEMSKIAKEPVTAELYENEDLYLFGSELACLRIAQANRHKKTNVGVANIGGYYVAIYSGR